jgi:hypothetical protein
MTGCPQWDLLAAARDREPESWAEALEHFDGCPRCRPEALDADPLLMFRRLPAAELSPAEEQSEVDSVIQAVAAMRTARRVESRRRFSGWRRWAAAAVLAFASLAVGRDRAPHDEAAAAAATAPAERPAPAPRAAAGSSTAIEGVENPGARVYQLSDDVVMVFDEKFDV